MEQVTTLALALAGDSNAAQTVDNELTRRHPADTLVQYVYSPEILGVVAIEHKDYAKAVEILQAAAPNELGSDNSLTPNLYIAHIRGEAYLGARQYGEAATEFQKILSYRGLRWERYHRFVRATKSGPSLCRPARYREGEGKLRGLSHLVKDADPDVPLLLQAKSEYAKLPTGVQKSPPRA